MRVRLRSSGGPSPHQVRHSSLQAIGQDAERLPVSCSACREGFEFLLKYRLWSSFKPTGNFSDSSSDTFSLSFTANTCLYLFKSKHQERGPKIFWKQHLTASEPAGVRLGRFPRTSPDRIAWIQPDIAGGSSLARQPASPRLPQLRQSRQGAADAQQCTGRGGTGRCGASLLPRSSAHRCCANKRTLWTAPANGVARDEAPHRRGRRR